MKVIFKVTIEASEMVTSAKEIQMSLIEAIKKEVPCQLYDINVELIDTNEVRKSS